MINKINPYVLAFATTYPIVGWYFDVLNRYCGIFGDYIFTVSYNELEKELDFIIFKSSNVFTEDATLWESYSVNDLQSLFDRIKILTTIYGR